jgi:hypothetical protein
MAEKIVMYRIPLVETLLSGSDLDPNESNGLDMLLSHTVEQHSLEWVDGLGNNPGNYEGLDELITENVQAVVLSDCSRGECQAKIRFESGNANEEGESKFVITCPEVSFDNKKQAAEYESKEPDCGHCHVIMGGRILSWLDQIPAAAEAAQQKVDSAKGELVLAKNALNNVFSLE